MPDPIRPRYSLHHLAADCPFTEEIRQKLENRHGTCFVAVETPTGTLIASVEDLGRFYPKLAEQLGEKSPKK